MKASKHLTNYAVLIKTIGTKLLILSLSGLMLTACEEQKPNKMSSPAVVRKYTHVTTLKGSVTYKESGSLSGTLKVTAADSGRLITSTTLENSNAYHIDIPEGTELPILLSFHPQDPHKEALLSAVVLPNLTQFDLNPLTTAIANKAKALGGYTQANMMVAAESTVHMPDDNKVSAGWRGDPTKQYGGWH